MSDHTSGTHRATEQEQDQAPADAVGAAPQESQALPAAVGAGAPLGKIRSTGTCILLAIVTLGIYTLVWYYKTHDEMKRHSGEGLGGVVALVLAFFVGIVMPYITSNEVGGLYRRAGQPRRSPPPRVCGTSRA